MTIGDECCFAVIIFFPLLLRNDPWRDSSCEYRIPITGMTCVKTNREHITRRSNSLGESARDRVVSQLEESPSLFLPFRNNWMKDPPGFNNFTKSRASLILSWFHFFWYNISFISNLSASGCNALLFQRFIRTVCFFSSSFFPLFEKMNSFTKLCKLCIWNIMHGRSADNKH